MEEQFSKLTLSEILSILSKNITKKEPIQEIINNQKYLNTYNNDKLHSFDNEPSSVLYDIENNIVSKSWHNNGVLHRLEYPAYIEYFPNGNIKKEEWYINGELKSPCKSKPCSITYDANSKWPYASIKMYKYDKTTIKYYYHSRENIYKTVVTCEDTGCSNTRKYFGGSLIKSYNKNKDGLLDSCLNEPAMYPYNKYVNGNIHKQKYYKNGKLHSPLEGAAVISHYSNGCVKSRKYYNEGVLIPEKTKKY